MSQTQYDEFDTDKMMLQWQWNSNYDDSWYVTKTDAYGKKTPDGSYIRLNALASTPLRPGAITEIFSYRNGLHLNLSVLLKCA